MKISRRAVLVLMMVWAVILLVPPLNSYFRLQVYNSNERGEALAVLSPAASTPNFWEKTARRFPNNRDILYQAALERPVSEIKEEHGGSDVPIHPYHIKPNLPPSVVFPGRFASDERDERVRRIEILRRKFPQDAFLVAAEIRARLASFQYERIGGELSDSTPKDKRPPGYVSPEKNGVTVNFTPADFQRVIALCRLGQKLEPENGYFDWMECYFLMYSWQDAEAFKALEAVGRKKQHDDHVGDELRAEVNAVFIAWGRPLLYEEKVYSFSWGTQAQHGRQRELARIIAWEATKAKRRGDHAQSIRIVAGLARAGGRMRDNARSYIDGLVAIAIEAIGWSCLTPGWRAAFLHTPQAEKQKQSQYQALRVYLGEHGQQALTNEAIQSQELTASFISQSRENNNSRSLGPSFPVAFSVLLLWVSGMKLLLLLVMPLIVLALMAMGKRIAVLRYWLLWAESGAEEVPTPREVWQGVLACIGLRAWAMALSGFLIFSLVEVMFLSGWATYSKQFHEVPFLKILFQDDTAYWSTWAQLCFSLHDVVYVDSPWRTVVFCVPILFGTLYAVWRAVEWQKQRNGEVSAWLSIGRAVDFGIMLVLVWSVFIQAFAKEVSVDSATSLVLALVTLACTAVLLGEKFLAWRKRPQRRATVRYGLRLLQRSLFSWLVVGSVIYLLTLVATTVVRHSADIEIDRVAAVGEVKAAQERVK